MVGGSLRAGWPFLLSLLAVGGDRENMLYRRLVVRLDAFGFVTGATLDVVRCTNSDGFIGDDGPS